MARLNAGAVCPYGPRLLSNSCSEHPPKLDPTALKKNQQMVHEAQSATMPPFIYINGYPGVGKLTVAKELW